MAFDGFDPDAFAFYRELEVHNERPWWLANKARYDEHVRAPFEALAEELEPVASAVKVYRPYRDVRFSHDKTPYKTRQGMFAQRAPASAGSSTSTPRASRSAAASSGMRR